MFKKLSFAHLLGAVLALSFIAGFAVFVLSGATTNKGTTGAISGRERNDHERGEDELSQVRHVCVDSNPAKRGTAHVQAGLQLRGLHAREALRDDRRRLPGLPVAGWLKNLTRRQAGGLQSVSSPSARGRGRIERFANYTSV